MVRSFVDLPVCSFSAPKSGSHMIGFGLGLRTQPIYHKASGGAKGERRSIEQQIKELSGWRDRGIFAHVPYSHAVGDYVLNNYRATFFVRRDPRDIVVSMAHYYNAHPSASTDMTIPGGGTMSEMEWEDRLMWLITYMGLSLPHYTGWIRPYVYQVKYEDVIDNRLGEFTKMHNYLAGLGLKPMSAEKMVEASATPHRLSFRKAAYGDWKETFTSRHVEWANKYLGHVIRDWGYT